MDQNPIRYAPLVAPQLAWSATAMLAAIASMAAAG
jgi:hypothetical protein